MSGCVKFIYNLEGTREKAPFQKKQTVVLLVQSRPSAGDYRHC